MYGNNMYPPYIGMGPNMMGRGISGGLGGLFRSSPMRNISANTGLVSKLKGGMNLGSILTNTQKTLGVINQAIPVVKQTGPMLNNMKTMFKLASAFKDTTTTKSEKSTKENNTNIQKNNNEFINQETINPNSQSTQQEKRTNNEPYFFI